MTRTLRPSRLVHAVIACAVASCALSASASTVVYSQSFPGCDAGGFGLSGLWHPATLNACSPGEPGCGLYFGQDATCDYDAGFAVSGSATSPVIDLTPYVGPATLTFDYRLGTEHFCDFDVAFVEVSTDGFTWTTLAGNCAGGTFLVEGGWTTAVVDLSAYAGQAIQLRFGFDTVDSSFNEFFGFAVSSIVVEATEILNQGLTLEGVSCQDDVSPAPGHQIAVDVWMRDVQAPGATGFQAFVEYDNALLTYRDDLSSYTAVPFSLHILNFGAAPPFDIEWAPGSLRIDGSAAPFEAPSTGDAKLATLVFDVLDECATTSLEFGGYPAFPVFFSELSLYGVPIATSTTNTDPLDLDDTPPVITCPADITTAAQILENDVCSTSDCCSSHVGAGCTDAGCQATVCGLDPFCCATAWDSICANEAVIFCPPTTDPCSGAVVTFSVGASDNCGTPLVVCTPPSGSVFPVGTTTVNCTAIDDCGNQSSCSFDITVTPTNYVLVDVALLVGSFTAPTSNRCIHFSTDSCGATTDETLAFSDDGLGFQTTGPVFIEVPCGDWSSLCVKDGQHTKWTTVGLTSVGTHYVATSTATLLPGDTDNDGDVDINDVTWLIFTYGAPAAIDPCPYVFPGPGPRDADFSLNGVVAGEDYSLLSDQFLTFSSCICTLPSEAPKARTTAVARFRRMSSTRICVSASTSTTTACSTPTTS
jgi:hypothetical protein